MSSLMPKTPFSTPLSGSAREVEARIRNIFQEQKKRPALIVMVLAVLLIALCGSLVAFQTQTGELKIAMQMQYYDQMGNYIEIPVLQSSTGQLSPDAQAVNAELTALTQEYRDYLAQLQGDTLEYRQCLLFPSTTDRYLNLVLSLGGSLDAASVRSWVYDLQEGRLVTLEEALALAGLTEEELFAALSAQYDPELAQTYPDAALCVQDPALEAFRIRENGEVVFYLTARVDDADDTVQDAVSGAEQLYLWQNGSFARYDQYSPSAPLIPAEEVDQMSPPLWCQWYFDGDQPEGGFATPGGDSADDALLDTLLAPVLEAGYYLDERDEITRQVLAALPSQDVTLAAAVIMNQQTRYALAIGLVDNASGALVAPIFQAASSGGLPHVTTFTRADGAQCLLYTANGMHQGYSYGEAGLVVLDGQDFTWVWPVEGDVRDESSQAYADYQAFWEHRKALLTPGGVEVFVENQEFGPYENSPVQWAPENSCSFYPTAEDDLVMGAAWQVRQWLEAFTRDIRNPWSANNTSAAWRILSLEPSEPMDSFAQRETPQTLYLLAQADNREDLYFAAQLVFDPVAQDGQLVREVEYGMGTLEEVTHLLPPARSGTFYSLLLDYYQGLDPDRRVYLAADQPDDPREGDLRLDSAAYAGSAVTYETVGAAYWVDASVYTTLSGILDWHSQQGQYVVLGRSAQDGSFYEVRGSAPYPVDRSLDLSGLILQVTYQLQDIEASLWRDGYSTPVGLGSWQDLFQDLPGGPTVEVLEGWEPIYWPGDRWERYSVDGFTALRYYNAAEDRYGAQRIEITRTDLCTFRGLRVGDSRQQVQTAYAAYGIYDTPYWDEEGDYLWYCGNGEGWGPAVLFFFEGDSVSRIVLNDMFN